MALGSRAKTGTVKVRKADNTKKAFELKLKGWSLRQIAEHMGISAANACMLVQEAISQHPVENLESYRAAELEKLDASERRQLEIIEAHMPMAKTKLDPGVWTATQIVNSCERTLDGIRVRRHKLLGLDAPQEVKVEGHIETTAHDDVVSELAKALAESAVGIGDSKADSGASN